MNLRLRLIVVFFLLSVVPVGAVTYITYSRNAQAIRDAAQFDAELLAGELSQRMRTVTTQLSQRVESLMALEQVDAPAVAPTTAAAAAPAPSVASGADAGGQPASTTPVQTDMVAALGDLAQFINNIDIVTGRGGRGRRGGGPPPSGQGGDQGRGQFGGPPQSGGQVNTSGRGPSPAGPGGVPPAQGTGAPAEALRGGGDPIAPQNAQNGGGRRGGGGRGGFNGDPDGRNGGGPGGGRVVEPPDPNRIRIDLGQIRRELFDELVPDRDAFNDLSEDDRAKIFAQIDQRMLGVQEGIALLQKELAARVGAPDVTASGAAQSGAATVVPAPGAAAAAALSSPTSRPSVAAPAPQAAASTAADSSSVAIARGAAAVAAAPQAAAPAPPQASGTPPSPPIAPAAPAAPPVPAPPTMQRSTALSGSRLAVRVERNGEVLGQVDADIDLPKLLAAVFETTSRDRGELPFAVGEDGQLYTPTEADKTQIEALQTTAVTAGSEPGTTVLADWILATTPDPTGSGLKFGIARPVGDSLRELQQTAARNAGLGLAFIVLALVIIVPLSAGLTRNLDRLSEGVNRIAQGDYGARVQVKSKDEIGRLAEAFNQMAGDVELHQRSAVEQERIRRELELGRQIQHDMLPHTPLVLGLTEVKGVSVPAREVGGDFFNYFQLQDGTIALLVGDVSGKGVGAALLMANIQAALRTRLSLGQDLASLAQELDVDIDRSTPGPVYATLFVGILDPIKRELRCVNAGHNPQYILRTTRALERMESTGRPIGLYSGGGYREQLFHLNEGDVLFFYTDGCVEAEDVTGEMFGSDRLEASLAASAGFGADAVIVAVEGEVSRFRAGVELQDDATMMVVKVG
jgi:serine phosphatase RsbU (regulator of sigma subunit)